MAAHISRVYGHGLFLVLVFGGRKAGVGLEVLAEGELLREAEFVRHLFDQHPRLAQQVLRLIDGDHVDPLHRRVVRLLPDDVREMTRREMLQLRIVLHGAVLSVFLVQRKQERDQDLAFLGRSGLFMQQLVREEESVFQQGLLPEQSDHGGEHLPLNGMVRVRQLLLSGAYLVHAAQEMPLLLVAQAHERRNGIDLLRGDDIRRNKRVDILDVVLQRNARVVVASVQFQHREDRRTDYQRPCRDNTLPFDGQRLRPSRRA